MAVNIRHYGGGSHHIGFRCPDLDEHKPHKPHNPDWHLQEAYKNTSFNYRRTWKLLPGWYDPPDCLKDLISETTVEQDIAA